MGIVRIDGAFYGHLAGTDGPERPVQMGVAHVANVRVEDTLEVELFAAQADQLALVVGQWRARAVGLEAVGGGQGQSH